MASTVQQAPRKHRLTVADYHCMGEAGILREDANVELIDGEIVDMAPISSPHAGTVAQLSDLLSRTVGTAALVWAQNPVTLGDHSEPQPDIALLKSRPDFYKTSHPRAQDVLLVVEVAESSLRYDRDVKMALYARHGIPEAWLVDLEGKRLTVFRGPRSNGYGDVSHYSATDRVSPLLLPEVEIALSGVLG